MVPPELPVVRGRCHLGHARKSRVTAEIYQLNLYDRAIIDVMIKSKGHVKSKIW